MCQKHSIFVCRDSGAFNSFLTKIACSALWRGFGTCFVTGSFFFTAYPLNYEVL